MLMSEATLRLFFSVNKGNCASTTYWLNNGANVNAQYNGITPLHIASGKGYPKTTRLLLDAKAIVDARSNEGMTPLHYASDRGHLRCINTLLAAKADVNATDNNGQTPLHYASDRGHLRCVNTLLAAKADVNATDNTGAAPLHYASNKSHENVVELLIKNSADVNAPDKNGKTPCHYALTNIHDRVLSALVDHGADINATDNSGQTPKTVYERHHSRNVIVTGFFFNKGISNTVGKLHEEVIDGDHQAVEALIKAGADVNGLDEVGNTPLFYARTRLSTVYLLLKHKADPTLINKSGRMAADYAQCAKIKQLLTSRVSSELSKAVGELRADNTRLAGQVATLLAANAVVPADDTALQADVA